MRAVLGAALVLSAAAAAPARADEAPPARDFALVGCTVHPGDGPSIADAIVVVRKGKVAAVGPAGETEVPKGVVRVAADGRHVTPGFVHVASRIGVRGNGGGNANALSPASNPLDELNPWLDDSRHAAEAGFASLGVQPGQGIVGGTGIVVRAGASDVASMLRRKGAFLRVDVAQGARFVSGLAGQLSIARKDLDGLEKWERAHAEWEKKKAAAEKAKKKVPKEPAKPNVSDARVPYHDVLKGDSALLCFVGSSADVVSLSEALGDETVRGEHLRLYCVIGGDAYRAAPELLDLGATCVVRAALVDWPGTDHTVSPAVHLRNAGLDVILMPRGDDRDGLRHYPIDLATQVAAGFPRGDVIGAATHRPAQLLGVDDQAGSIAKERCADLVLWSGDPLLATTRIEAVWIDGDPVEDLP